MYNPTYSVCSEVIFFVIMFQFTWVNILGRVGMRMFSLSMPNPIPFILFCSPPRPGQLKLKSLCYLRIVIRNGVRFNTWIILFSLCYWRPTDTVLLTDSFGVIFLCYYIGMALSWLAFMEIVMLRSESIQSQILKCI